MRGARRSNLNFEKELAMRFLKLMLISVALAATFVPAAEAQRVRQTTSEKKIEERKISDLARDEIRCRGYSGIGGSEYVFFTINSRPTSTGETIVTYEMAFTPSVKAAGSKGEGLRPGECSFVDRPISQSGPYRIRFDTSANAQLRQQLHGTAVDTSPTAAERFPDAQTIPAYLKDPNHYWSFFGAKPVGSFFVATGHKFWKPGLEVFRSDDAIRLKKNTPYVLTPKKPE
jgi:hypothetical protein